MKTQYILNLCYWLFLMFFIISCSQKELNRAAENTVAPKVVAVYPTNDSLPENLLRFYVQFSHAMKTVNNLENIKLVKENGEEIRGAIFNNVYELWDSEQKQLTLILDPARVKTGLVVNENLGRALAPNKRFQLVIEKAEDIYGNLLEAPYTKGIHVIKEDKEIPNINNWKIISPESNTLSPLEINFPQVLDRLSLFHRLRLMNENEEIVTGEIEVVNQEKTWRFIPQEK